MNENLKQTKEVLDILQREYDKGYADGYSVRDSQIIRCKDCKIWNREPINYSTKGYCYLCNSYTREEEYCSKGVKQ